jgi:hypothetical protein
MPGVNFMQSAPNSFRTEATSFEDDARFDLHKASENITPAKEYFENQEIDAKTKEAMAIAAQNGFDDYVAEGINEIEQYLQGNDRPQYEYLHGVGERMEFWRKSETV